MSKSARVFSAIVASCAALSLSTAALAATASFDDFDVTTDFALADIISVDPLGYTCIREEQIDLAFHASGKGVRLPQTCLPEPCRAALTKFELASLIGRPAFPKEWDDYVSRYADHCRKEIVPFNDAAGVEETADDPVSFWTPLVGSYPSTAPIRAGFPPTSVASRGPGGFGGSLPPIGGTPPRPNWPGPGDDPEFPGPPTDPERKTIRIDERPRPGPDPRDQTPPIPAVPLPSGLVLFVTGLACLFMRLRGTATG